MMKAVSASITLATINITHNFANNFIDIIIIYIAIVIFIVIAIGLFSIHQEMNDTYPWMYIRK